MAQMSITEIITDVIAYIEQHIREPLSLDQLSHHTYISKYHLHRLFSSMTNKPLVSYIRKRKLSTSVQDLIHSHLKIIDIASEYGFGSEQSYIRAFKKTFGITPSRFRKHPSSITLTEPVNLYPFEEISNGIILPPVFVIHPQMKVVGIKQEMNFHQDVLEKELPRAIANQFYYKDRHTIKHAINEHIYLGISYVNLGKPHQCAYMSAVEVENFSQIPEGMTYETIPSNRYTVFRYIALKHPSQVSFSDFHSVWQFINRRWLVHTDVKRLNYHFEYINGHVASENYCEIDLYIPLKDATMHSFIE